MAVALRTLSYCRLFSGTGTCQRLIVNAMTSLPRKRQRLMSNDSPEADDIRAKRADFLSSLSRPISPPAPLQKTKPSTSEGVVVKQTTTNSLSNGRESPSRPSHIHIPTVSTISSPISLTRIRGLPAEHNIDTVSLHDILGDPLISEAWIFNFCFDVDWLMQHFDADVRQLVKVKIVHGSWRKEDSNKIGIDEACRKWKNVESLQAYLPDAFGTHHSKMFILFRHDMQAQVIIHTANMLEKDWTNMTQAVWRSPLLPLLDNKVPDDATTMGYGSCFKNDLTRYLKAYGSKSKSLRENLDLYDFKDVRAALIASVPSKFSTKDANEKIWGHLSLKRIIRRVSEISQTYNEPRSHLVCQISSIATLPTAWLDQTIVKAAFPITQDTSSPTDFKSPASPSDRLSIIYPTPADVAVSLDGYYGGGSIHTKAQSAAHLKQIAALRPHLHRWTEAEPARSQIRAPKQAHRHLAAPHIKTYISFANKPSISNPTPDINWALLTSANLSTQAWGTVPKPSGHSSSGSSKRSPAKLKRNPVQEEEGEGETVHIQSYEIGVLFWPEMFSPNSTALESIDQTKRVRMVPAFGQDMPAVDNNMETKTDEAVVGFRMPYDLPLTPYVSDEMPWSPQSRYTVADRHGRTWPPDATWFKD